MSTRELTVGFLPLVDACLPILAQEHGFAEEEGLHLSFIRDVSWATVLDRLLYGHSDAAHMLAPLAIATTLGRGRPAQAMSTPFVLGLNGNGITLARGLAARVTTPGLFGDPRAIGAALKQEAERALAAGKRLRFGVVHRYSSHNYKLRYWLAASGIRPDVDVEITTVAPPFVPDALASGEIDGACVGEPWNSVCVERGVGTIVLATAQIWRRGVEKVLAMREAVLEEKRPETEALIRAMRKAGRHFVDPANWEENARILALPQYLAADARLVQRAISDRLVLDQGAAEVHYPRFHVPVFGSGELPLGQPGIVALFANGALGSGRIRSCRRAESRASLPARCLPQCTKIDRGRSSGGQCESRRQRVAIDTGGHPAGGYHPVCQQFLRWPQLRSGSHGSLSGRVRIGAILCCTAK